VEAVGSRPDLVAAEGAGLNDRRLVVRLLVDQVECANVLVLNKLDLLTDSPAPPPQSPLLPQQQQQEQRRQLPGGLANRRAAVEGILRSLNPAAQLVPASFSRVDLAQVLGTGLFQATVAAGSRRAVARGSGSSNRPFSASASGAAAISSFVYERRGQPFHPGRLHRLVRGWQQGGARRVLRAKGFVHVGGRAAGSVFWSLAGNHLVLLEHPDGTAAQRLAVAQGSSSRGGGGGDSGNGAAVAAAWPHRVGPLRGCSQVVFIGVRLQEPAIAAVLDACLMTPAEIAAGARFCDAGEVHTHNPAMNGLMLY